MSHHYERADAARRLGDLQLQIVELRKAHAMSGGSTHASELLASALHLNGDWDEARRLREEILAGNISRPLRFVNSLTLAQYYAQAGDFGRADKVLAEAMRAAASLGRSPGTRAHAHEYWSRSNIAFFKGMHEEGERFARIASESSAGWLKSLGRSATDQERYWRNLIDSQFARALMLRGKLGEAEWVQREVIERARSETGAESIQTARMILYLADIQLRQRRFEKASERANEALDLLRSIGAAPAGYVMSQAFELAGTSAALAGEFSTSDRLFVERDKALGSSPENSQIQGSKGVEAWGYALIALGRHGEAATRLGAAIRTARQRTSHDGQRVLVLEGLQAFALLRSGRRDEAASQFARVVPDILANRKRLRVEDRVDALYEAQVVWILEGYLESLCVTASAGSASAVAEAFRIADVARSSSVDRAVALAAGRAALPDARLAALARTEQDLGNRVAALGQIVEGLLAQPTAAQPSRIISATRADIERLASERTGVRGEIATQFPGYSELIDPSYVSIENAQRTLQSGEALFAMYATADRTYVWGIPKAGEIRFAVVSMGKREAADITRRLRAALDVGDAGVERLPVFDVALSHALYQRLLAPVDVAWRGARTLIAVPHGPIGELPLAVLATSPMEGIHSRDFAGYRKVPWLVRDIALSQTPTVGALVALRARRAPSSSSRAFIGFGDPAFALNSEGGDVGGARGIGLRNLALASVGDMARPGTGAALAKLPSLPDTAIELREIAATLGADASDLRLGREASESNVRAADLMRYRVISFATHGLSAGDVDGLTQPALALSNPMVTGERDVDGLLTLDEVLSLRLQADWVVLSACNTAAGDEPGGQAISGLGRAFFYAGARALLVSNWPVETVSARLLTTGVFREQARTTSLSRAESLRRSILGLLDTEEAKDTSGTVLYTYAHPIFWAPFVLVGDGPGL